MYPSSLEYFRERESISLVDFDYDRNLFEIEQNSALPVLKGRLRSCLSYWHTIGANSFVIDIIKFGYRIPFISTPCQARFSNNQSALNNASFVESAIAELVHTHAVVELPFIPHVVNPLSVSIQSSGKKRLILDLSHVNHFVWKQKFRCEDWRVLLSYVNKGDYLFSFDLKSAYHHIDIFPDHQTFLGFSWVFFLVPFGIFVLHHFRSVLAQPHMSLPSVSDHSLSFGGPTGLKLLRSLTMGAEKGTHCLWPRKIHCLCNHP